MGWKTEILVQQMMDAEDFYASEIVQVKVPSLYNGRFVLVGDAGYAVGPIGNGTTLALTGAYILAGEVGKHAGDLAAGLRGYEMRMRPLIEETQKIPPLVPTILAPQTVLGNMATELHFRLYCLGWHRRVCSEVPWCGFCEF